MTTPGEQLQTASASDRVAALHTNPHALRFFFDSASAAEKELALNLDGSVIEYFSDSATDEEVLSSLRHSVYNFMFLSRLPKVADLARFVFKDSTPRKYQDKFLNQRYLHLFLTTFDRQTFNQSKSADNGDLLGFLFGTLDWTSPSKIDLYSLLRRCYRKARPKNQQCVGYLLPELAQRRDFDLSEFVNFIDSVSLERNIELWADDCQRNMDFISSLAIKGKLPQAEAGMSQKRI